MLARQRTGFWRRLGNEPAFPDYTAAEAPQRIYTFEPWLGCLWGTSCEFCYVPNLSERFYPDGRDGPWYRDWGRWLLPKPDISQRLRRALFTGSGSTRTPVRGAFVFMSAKTDPFLPTSATLAVTQANLDVFAEADIFLMCQTRSQVVVEDSAIFKRLVSMAQKGRVGVSFSISTDMAVSQRMIERGGLSPDRRLDIMGQLKAAGVFVSAAVSPIMPFSADFAERLRESANHASIQPLRITHFGATSPIAVLSKVRQSVADYETLPTRLTAQFGAQEGFAWGIGNKGFIGAFLAARRHYGPQPDTTSEQQLPLAGIGTAAPRGTRMVGLS